MEEDGAVSRHGATQTALPHLVALDGLRGMLAVIVMINHVVLLGFGSNALFWPGRIAVLLFFAMSACVLCRGWDGRFGVFLVKRFLRLWPAFAACLAIGVILFHGRPAWSEFFWYPVFGPSYDQAIDPPMWSLSTETRAFLFMPVIVWSGRGSPLRSVALTFLWYAILGPTRLFAMGAAFLLGARLARIPSLRVPWLEGPSAQFLGRLSYSLYLCHWIVLRACVAHFGAGAGVTVGAPLSLLAAWLLWTIIDAPSIRLSRRAGRWFRAVGRAPSHLYGRPISILYRSTEGEAATRTNPAGARNSDR